MSTPYNGRPGNETRNPTAPAVTGATSTTPIVITVASTHGLEKGDIVEIYGVEGNTAANGVFYVDPTGLPSDQFAIYKSWASGAPADPVPSNGVYVATTGQVKPLTWLSQVMLPDDGDALQASAFNVPFEGNFDREAWLVSRLGGYQLMRWQTVPNGQIPGATWATILAPYNAWTPLGFDYLATYSAPQICLAPNDTIDVNFWGACDFSSVVSAFTSIRLRVKLFDFGGSVVSTVEGMPLDFYTVDASLISYRQVSLSITATNSSSRGLRAFVYLEGFCTDSTPQTSTINFTGGASMDIKTYRPNG